MAKDLTAALQALTDVAQGTTSRTDKALPGVMVAPPIPERTGASGPLSSLGAGGIASPLVETAYADRTFHPAREYSSTDGIFVISLKPVKTISFKDKNESPLVMEYKAKT